MVFIYVVAAIMVGYGTAWVASPDVRFLSRAGRAEFNILAARRPIADIVADPATPDEQRRQLQLVLAARDHAAALGYDAGQTYTQFTDVGRDTLMLVLSASPADCLCAHTWKWPIVGRVPYKGFFDPAAALREAESFGERGYDTWVRPAGAFSTLGWFEDPLLSTALDRDSVELAALVFHEIAHNTLYVKSATTFNESFAQLAGYRGAQAFFAARGEAELAQRAEDRWLDEMLLGGWYDSVATRLTRLYDADPDSAALALGRAEVGTWAGEELTRLAPAFRTFEVAPGPRPVNNARIISARIYRTRLDLFERWFERSDGDIREAVASLRTLVEGVEGEAAAFDRLAGELE